MFLKLQRFWKKLLGKTLREHGDKIDVILATKERGPRSSVFFSLKVVELSCDPPNGNEVSS